MYAFLLTCACICVAILLFFALNLPQLHAHALDVLTCCLEELEVIPVAVLDAFLLFLLPSARQENATAYQIVQVKKEIWKNVCALISFTVLG